MTIPAHIDRAGLSARIGATELSRLESAGADVDTALSDANAVIASYAPAPLDAPEPRLAWVGAAIARRHLFTVSPSEAVEEGYKSAIAWLTKWASGVVTLRVEMAQPAQPTPEQIAAWLADGWDEYGAVWSKADTRMFTASALKDF